MRSPNRPHLFETAAPPVDEATSARRALAERWTVMRGAVGLDADTPCAVALSGGADSVLLLLLASTSRARLVAIHVDHGLRGEESAGDAAFCARLCARLGVPFVRRRIALGAGGNLEERARSARYRALAAETRRAGCRALLTGHHADDALETLLLRWLRGSAPEGLAGPRARSVLAGHLDPDRGAAPALVLLRPLLPLRRAEVRTLLANLGETWREDSSNAASAHARNRLRNDLLPLLERSGGAAAVDSLRAFARSVEALEDELAARTTQLAWRAPLHAGAVRAPGRQHLGGTLERAALCALATPLRRRALHRLLRESTGHAPRRAVLALLLDDLARGRCTRRSLGGAWTLHLRSRLLVLEPPPAALTAPRAERPARPAAGEQLALPGLGPLVGDERRLPVGGSLELPDGRVLLARLVTLEPGTDVPRDPCVVELDAEGIGAELRVRFARAGDRFHPLGAPGSRPLRRFLADCGVPRGERERVPLVFADAELLWAAGIRPAQARRVRPSTRRRLRLQLA